MAGSISFRSFFNLAAAGSSSSMISVFIGYRLFFFQQWNRDFKKSVSHFNFDCPVTEQLKPTDDILQSQSGRLCLFYFSIPVIPHHQLTMFVYKQLNEK